MLALVLLCLSLYRAVSLPAVVEEVVESVHVSPLGGWRELPVDSQKVKTLAKFVEQSYNRESDSEYWYQIRDVQTASMQVVNGVNYMLDLTLEQSGCLKEGRCGNEKCELPGTPDQRVIKCWFEIWERSWLNEISVTSKQCEQSDAGPGV